MTFEQWWEKGGGGVCGKDACRRAWNAGRRSVAPAQRATNSAMDAISAIDEAFEFSQNATEFYCWYRKYRKQLPKQHQ